jgi:hypothetical protein
MFRSVLILGLAGAAAAFAPSGGLTSFHRAAPRAACGLRMQESNAQVKLTPALFAKLDVDGSGSIDANELKLALGDAKDVDAFMARADKDGNGSIDYAEYERLMSMDQFSDAQGGNLYVRNAINLGLLRKDSILSDNVLVGNKGFDPLNCATSAPILKQYREAELKHGRLAMLAAAGWPVSELFQPLISQTFKLPDLLTKAGEVPPPPSTLNPASLTHSPCTLKPQNYPFNQNPQPHTSHRHRRSSTADSTRSTRSSSWPSSCSRPPLSPWR